MVPGDDKCRNAGGPEFLKAIAELALGVHAGGVSVIENVTRHDDAGDFLFDSRRYDPVESCYWCLAQAWFELGWKAGECPDRGPEVQVRTMEKRECPHQVVICAGSPMARASVSVLAGYERTPELVSFVLLLDLRWLRAVPLACPDLLLRAPARLAVCLAPNLAALRSSVTFTQGYLRIV